MVGQTSIVGCRIGADRYAFLTGADGVPPASPLRRWVGCSVARSAMAHRRPSCGAHFAVRRAGACLEEPELHLDPLPLLLNQGVATVALPTTVAA